MPERPEPPQWGALITAALRAGGLSARQAARRAGISEGRWRQISGGYQVIRPGVYVPVRGPADTLARMAAVAGVSADELRAAGREDAAQVLDDEAGVARRDRAADDEVLERIRSLDGDRARKLLVQIVRQLRVAANEPPRHSGDPR